MEHYRVRRSDEVDFIAAAIEASGGRIVERPAPNLAPFVFRVVTPDGESLELICYAFRANRYKQGGRPRDEHRFQLKYGSEFERYHDIHIASGERSVTLMFGVHIEEGVLVGVDPTMHNPTWFSLSVEFKDADVADTKDKGWHGWERSRSNVRRKIDRPLASYQTEVLLGLTPEHFLRYVQLERATTGLDPGERLLLIDKMAKPQQLPAARPGHPLESELGMTANELLDMISGAFRLKVAVRGSVAEHHLRLHLESIPDMTEVTPLDRDGQPDFRVVYRKGPPVLIECKNVLRRVSGTLPKVDFQRTRASKGDPCSRYYRRSDFDVLAACLHPVTEQWTFRFAPTRALPPHKHCEDRISQHVLVEPTTFTPEITELLQPSRL